MAGRPAGAQRSPGSQVGLEVARKDGTTVELVDEPGAGWPHPIEASRLESGTGYLRIRCWSTDDEDAIDQALEDLDSTPRLLVDLRGNAGGMLAAAAAFRNRFVTRECRLARKRAVLHRRRDPLPQVPDPRNAVTTTSLAGRVRFLTDPLTYSASEDAILGLSRFEHVDVVGQPSGGGTGRPRTIPLLEGVQLSVSTALTYDHLDRCIEDNGINVDRHIDSIIGETAIEQADQDW